MSNKLPIISGRRMVKFLEAREFLQRPRKGGSHITMDKGGIEVTVPDHKELRPGTLSRILRDARIDREEFIRAIRSY